VKLKALTESLAGDRPAAGSRTRRAGVRIMAIGAAVIALGVVGMCAGLVSSDFIAEIGYSVVLFGGYVFARGAEWATGRQSDDSSNAPRP